jgi:hypothetical protein
VSKTKDQKRDLVTQHAAAMLNFNAKGAGAVPLIIGQCHLCQLGTFLRNVFRIQQNVGTTLS